MPRLRTLLLGLALSSCLTTGALAVDLTIGSSTEPTAIDPHFSRSGNSQQIAAQVFNRPSSLTRTCRSSPVWPCPGKTSTS